MMMGLQRLWIQITSDRRRFGVLCLSMCAALLLWARIIVISKPPRTAVADEEINQVATDGVAGDADAALADNKPRPTITVELEQTPNRDPFAISNRYFPKPAQLGQFPAEGDKSEQQQAEDSLTAEQRQVAHWKALIEGLSLDAVMSTSGRPMAVIGGQMYRVGDRVKPGTDPSQVFELVEVADRSVFLSRDGHRFELKMAPPGGR